MFKPDNLLQVPKEVAALNVSVVYNILMFLAVVVLVIVLECAIRSLEKSIMSSSSPLRLTTNLGTFLLYSKLST